MTEGKPKQIIILDSNIIGYLFVKNLGDLVWSLIVKLGNRGFGITISEITYFEILKMAPKSDLDKILSALKTLPTYDVNLDVLIKASDLYRLCLNDGIPKEQVDTEDYIVGATATLTGSLIYTANLNDYPRPYFREKAEKVFAYKSKNNSVYQVTQLLEPNIQLIEKTIKTITKKSKLK